MAARYNTLIKNEQILLQENCPVIIEASALLKDNATNKILLQIKLKNLSEKALISCKVAIKASELNNNPLQGIDSYTYLDILISQGESFGSKSPITLPDSNTRKYSITIEEIVFADASIWKASSRESFPLDAPERIFSDDPQLLSQYSLEEGGNVIYRPFLSHGFFYCTCGTINISGIPCYQCHRTYENLQKPLSDPESLLLRYQERKKEETYQQAEYKSSQDKPAFLLEAKELYISLADYKDSAAKAESCQQRYDSIQEDERLKKETAEKKAAEEEKMRQEKSKKQKKRAFLLVAAIIVLGVLVYLTPNAIIPFIQYNIAMKNLNNGDYDAAQTSFHNLIGFKDADLQEKEAIYQRANLKYEQHDYAGSVADYASIPDYKDALEQEKKSNYTLGLELYENEQYKDALTAFTNAKEYSDAGEKKKEVCYILGNEALAQNTYNTAVDLFKEASGYADSETKMRLAMFRYVNVKSSQNPENKTTCEYLEYLKACNYPQIGQIYEKIYPLTFEVFFTNSQLSNFPETSVDSIYNHSSLYIWYRLRGGYSNTSMLISKVVIQWPDNSKTEHTINKTVSNSPKNESYFGGGFGYDKISCSKTGLARVTFYNNAGETVRSVYLTIK